MNNYSIVIVHYSSIDDTINCLDSLKKSNHNSINIILIDNSDHEKHKFPIEKYDCNLIKIEDNTHCYQFNASSLLIYIKSVNKGFSHANNIGISFALENHNCEWIWLLNNDTVVKEDILSIIDKNIPKLDKNVGMIGHDIFFLNDTNSLQGIAGRFSYKLFQGSNLIPKTYNEQVCNETFYKEAEYILGASMFVRRDFILDVGLLDENYFLYYEEIDWALRGKLKNWKIGYVHGAKIFHKEGASIGSSASVISKSDLATYHGIRSKIIFIKKHFKHKRNVIIFLMLISLANRILHGKFKNAIKVLKIYRTYW